MATASGSKINLEVFLEEVRKYPCLFDKKRKDYKDSQLKKSLWHVIGSKFNLSGPVAETKWKVQRDRFTKEKRKVRDSLGTGKGTLEVYVPKWFLYQQMESILNVCSSENTSICSITEYNDDSLDGEIDSDDELVHSRAGPSSPSTPAPKSSKQIKRKAEEMNLVTNEDMKLVLGQ
ncbi:uncharacterized protein LOC129233558 [Uloborus diversus]|uniref:uncharacterized protein LOC129233558 n=1 Tax=Uloborus diversus TaxID=327109 RepID=UPI002409DFC4|nr:uncharacterized protein LOC129233558 [Uloborus diversus]